MVLSMKITFIELIKIEQVLLMRLYRYRVTARTAHFMGLIELIADSWRVPMTFDGRGMSLPSPSSSTGP